MYHYDDGIPIHLEYEGPRSNDCAVPLVILIHGLAGNTEEPHLLAAAEAIRESGFAVLRAEMYGHGKSGGTFREHTLFKWISNAIRVIDYARSLDHITGIYLCGHSQGGLLAMLAAAMKRDVIRGMILLSPACNIPEDTRNGKLLEVSFDPDHVPDELVMEEGGALLGTYVRVAQTIRVEETAPKFTGPVLIIHGEADDCIPLEVSIEAAKMYENCMLVQIPEDNHVFDFHTPEMTRTMKSWLKDQREKLQ